MTPIQTARGASGPQRGKKRHDGRRADRLSAKGL